MDFIKKIERGKVGQDFDNMHWWRSRPPEERWEAMLQVREQAWMLYCLGKNIPYAHDRPFQKVYSIVKRSANRVN